MRRFWVYGVLVAAVALIGFQLYQAYANELALNNQYQKAKAATDALVSSNQDLAQQVQYYSDPHNLEKDVREQTNYRSPNEKLIITTPQQ
ncbi:MAG: septum formation initiator family protein [Patescibacteria group bacterium]|nr:septum formation initiator family protein [Patescibacteria group bacterium]MCL5224229.1 septum formation initiator family protein [Patescibacteria group bacterium]